MEAVKTRTCHLCERTMPSTYIGGGQRVICPGCSIKRRRFGATKSRRTKEEKAGDEQKAINRIGKFWHKCLICGEPSRARDMVRSQCLVCRGWECAKVS